MPISTQWNSHGFSGNVFANPRASFSSPEIHSTLRREDSQRMTRQTCTCSQFPTEAVLWIKEVELVDSVDDLKSSRSVIGTPGPNFELLEHCFCTKQNHPEYRFKKKVSLEEIKAHKEDRFLRGRQIAYLIYEYFRVTGPTILWSYADLCVALRNDNVQEFDTKWCQ